MAKFNTIPPFTGTIGPICVYQMYGRYFLRTRSSLTGERVKKDPAFRKTMEYAGWLAQASRIGSAVYAALPAKRKQHTLYRKLTGEAMTWLKYGWIAADVLEYLMKIYVRPVSPAINREPEADQLPAAILQGTRKEKSSCKKTPAVEFIAAGKYAKHLLEYQQLVRIYRRDYRQMKNSKQTYAKTSLPPSIHS